VDAKVHCATAQEKPTNFDDWILRVMGEGIADIFMRPYNFKVWAVPTTYMQCGWLGERVATVDTAKAISNVLHNKVTRLDKTRQD
jgi:protoporphyrinogen oxidase